MHYRKSNYLLIYDDGTSEYDCKSSYKSKTQAEEFHNLTGLTPVTGFEISDIDCQLQRRTVFVRFIDGSDCKYDFSDEFVLATGSVIKSFMLRASLKIYIDGVIKEVESVSVK